MIQPGNAVLVVDDEYLIAELLSEMLEEMGMQVCGTAASAGEAVAMAQLHQPPLVLMDVRLRGPGDGVQAAIEIHRTVGSRVIFITGSREPATVARIQADHPSGLLFKPILFDQLQQAVRQALA